MKTKTIKFKTSQRKQATIRIKALIKKGWKFQCGLFMDNGLVDGGDLPQSEWIDGERTEEIVLYF